MDVKDWIAYLQYPPTLIGFCLFVVVAFFWLILSNGKNCSETGREKLIGKSMDYAFSTAIVAIIAVVILNWDSAKSPMPNMETAPDTTVIQESAVIRNVTKKTEQQPIPIKEITKDKGSSTCKAKGDTAAKL